MKSKHAKHPSADRLKAGKYHVNEFGIYGTDCSSIQFIVDDLIQDLQDFKCLYVDADHKAEGTSSSFQIREKQFNYSFESHLFDQEKQLNANKAEVVFVNGNHYPAQNQIIVINDKKRESLLRRVDQLDSIFAILVNNSEDEIYPFLKEKMNKNTIIIKGDNKALLLREIRNKIQSPKLKALILAGGKSQRMGHDKSQIQYHGKSQESHLQDLCLSCGLDTYISKSHDYDGNLENCLRDRLVNMGPLGAICTAFMKDRNTAWLVIACDMPFIDKKSINTLIESRKKGVFATSYSMSLENFPEPTFTIYEPRIYKRILEFMSLGYTCPRKVLINSEIKKIVPNNLNILRNINTQSEMNLIEKQIQQLD